MSARYRPGLCWTSVLEKRNATFAIVPVSTFPSNFHFLPAMTTPCPARAIQQIWNGKKERMEERRKKIERVDLGLGLLSGPT